MGAHQGLPRRRLPVGVLRRVAQPLGAWCSMASCGNRAKARAFRAASPPSRLPRREGAAAGRVRPGRVGRLRPRGDARQARDADGGGRGAAARSSSSSRRRSSRRTRSRAGREPSPPGTTRARGRPALFAASALDIPGPDWSDRRDRLGRGRLLAVGVTERDPERPARSTTRCSSSARTAAPRPPPQARPDEPRAARSGAAATARAARRRDPGRADRRARLLGELHAARTLRALRVGLEIYLAPTADDGDAWQATLVHLARESRAFVVSPCAFQRRDSYPESFPLRDELTDELVGRGGSAILAPSGAYLAGPLRDEEGSSPRPSTPCCSRRSGSASTRRATTTGRTCSRSSCVPSSPGFTRASSGRHAYHGRHLVIAAPHVDRRLLLAAPRRVDARRRAPPRARRRVGRGRARVRVPGRGAAVGGGVRRRRRRSFAGADRGRGARGFARAFGSRSSSGRAATCCAWPGLGVAPRRSRTARRALEARKGSVVGSRASRSSRRCRWGRSCCPSSVGDRVGSSGCSRSCSASRPCRARPASSCPGAADEFTADAMPGIDARFMQNYGYTPSLQPDPQRKTAQAAADDGDYPLHASRRKEPRQSTDSSTCQRSNPSNRRNSPETNPASMLTGRSCRVTSPHQGRIRSPRKWANRTRQGSQKHRTRHFDSILPSSMSVSVGKWCTIMTPNKTSPTEFGRCSKRFPCFQKIDPGSRGGRDERSKPVTVAPGNQDETFRHNRPSPAPISRNLGPPAVSGLSYFLIARRNACFTQK